MDKDLTPKQQTSEALRQAETILVMTGQHPSIDQVASTIALTAILRKFGKKVTSVISDDVPAGARFLSTKDVDRQMGGLRDFIIEVGLGRAEVDKLKYDIADGKLNIHITPFSGGFQSRDVTFSYGDYQFDAIIVLGVASYARLDKVYVQNAEVLHSIPLINIDYHRSNEQYGAINLIEPTAASLAEILIALSESLQGGMIDDQIATTMLTGIMAATDRFTATHTTAKTMTVAAQMLAMGADQQKIVKNLYRSDKSGDRQKPQAQPSSQNQPKRDKPAERQPIEKIDSKPLPQAQAQTAAPAPAPAPQAALEPVVSTPQPQSEPVISEPVAQAVLEAPVYQPPLQMPAAPRVNPEPVAVDPQPEPVRPPRDPNPPAPASTVASAADTMPIPAPTPEAAEPDTSPQLPQTPESRADAAASREPVAAPSGNLDNLLPPQQLDPAEPEPLINDTTPVSPKPATPSRASNPINNPIFAQRLDELDY